MKLKLCAILSALASAPLMGSTSCGGGTELVRVVSVHSNHLGSPVLATSVSGVLERASFSPYGEVGASTGSLGLGSPTHGFTGHEHDAESGLYYMQARYYDPRTARFLSPDPALNSGGASFGDLESQPQAQNAYSYTYNRPTMFTDPNGENPVLMYYAVVYGPVATAAAVRLATRWGPATARWLPRLGRAADATEFGITTAQTGNPAEGLRAALGPPGLGHTGWASNRTASPAPRVSNLESVRFGDGPDFSSIDKDPFRYRIVSRTHARYQDALNGVARPFDETPIGAPLTPADLDWRFRAYQADDRTLPTDLTTWFEIPVTQRGFFHRIDEGVILQIPNVSAGPGWRVVPDTFGFHEGAAGGLPTWIQGTVSDAHVIPFRNR